MTAIARFYVSDGFVVATDGLMRDATTRKGIDEAAQKLFQVGTSKLSYALNGAHVLGSPGDDSFDFREQLEKAIRRHPAEEATSLPQYARRVCGTVLDLLKNEADKLTFPKEIDGIPGTIVHVAFNGYVREIPESVTIRFNQRDGIVGELEVTSEPLDQRLLFGSALVADELDRKNPAFQKYISRVPKRNRPLSSRLEKAMSCALTYIAACASPEGRKLDPMCHGINNRVGMAVIRPATGFAWVPGYDPTQWASFSSSSRIVQT